MKKDFYLKDIKAIKEFFETEGKKLLFYHMDADGMCSAVSLLKFYPGFEPIPRKGPNLDRKTIEFVLRREPRAIAFFDLPVDQSWEGVTRIKKELKDSKILILDHHIPEKDLNSKEIMHINPRFHRKIYLPASYLIYRILKRLRKDIDNFAWIPTIGVIGDYALTECRDLFSACRRKSPGLLGKNPLESEIFKGVELISSAITMKNIHGAAEALEFLAKSKSFREFSEAKSLNEYNEKINSENKRLLGLFETKKEHHPEKNLIFYLLDTEFNSTSTIANRIAEMNPKSVVIIINKAKEGGYKVSLRCQTGGVNVGLLAKTCTKDIGSGGGHEQAAGALVNDIERFKKRIMRELEKQFRPT